MTAVNKRNFHWLPKLIALVFLCLFVLLWFHEWKQQEQQWQQQLLIVSDVNQAFATYQSQRRVTAVIYLLALLTAEFALWYVFYVNNKHVAQLICEHQKQLQQETKMSERRLEHLNLALESTESGFWEWNIATNRAVLSKEWRELCGLPIKSAGDTDIEEWLMQVHPNDKKTCYCEMIRHIKGETAFLETEYRLRIADGSYIWMFTRGKVVEWEDNGYARLLVGFYTNISKYKQHELTSNRQQTMLRALGDMAAFTPSADLYSHLGYGLGIAARVLALEFATVSHIQGNQYKIVSQIPLNDTGSVPAIDALSNHYCEETYRSREIFTLDDARNSPLISHFSYKKFGIVSYIGIPLWLHGSLYGTLSFSATQVRSEPFDGLDHQFMQLLAHWVTHTLNHWQYASEQQVIVDRFAKLSANLPGFLYQFQMFTDGRSCFPYIGVGIESIFGIKAGTLKQSAAAVFDAIHPDDLGWVGESLSVSAAKLRPWVGTYRILHPVRGEIWVRGEAKPERMSDASTLWHGYIRDVTTEKNAELKLQEMNALREAIFDAASIAIVATDQHGMIKSFNHSAEIMLGYSSTEMIDIQTPVILHLPEEICVRAEKLSRELGQLIEPNFEVFTARAREGKVDENEWTYVCKDGSRLAIILSVTALRNATGDITGYLGLARDISELKRIDQMKTEFISTVSHELRTPLTAITGSLGIIVSGAVGEIPDSADKMLGIAHKNSLRLIHIVNDLLDMEKLVAGKMRFDLQTQSLLPIVQQAIDANASEALQYQVRFQLNNRELEDIRVTVDSLRLQQVLTNMLSNAAKFSSPNDVVIIDIEKNVDVVRVSVSDKGIGISDIHRHRIFQKFSQVDSSDTRQKGGAGLGLAVSREIIERMGGKIDFDSVVGQGSTFYFEIPCEDIYRRSEIKYNYQTLAGKRILVVEDNPEIAELLAMILRANHYRVDIAYTGKIAQQHLTLHNYQLVTIDLNLPDMNGRELIKQLRSDSSTQQIPIIVITLDISYGRESEQQDALFTGVQWLEKPLEADNLIDVIYRALQKNVKEIL